jgi:hypothetical protein
MNMKHMIWFTASAAALASVLAVSPAAAQSRAITRPNTTTAPGAEQVTLEGQVFVNQGLIGAGRLDANVRDFAGETLGSFSSLAIDLSTWRRNADGSYSGNIFTLPDRGPNGVGPFTGTTDYRSRVHTSSITLRPDTSGNVLPQAITSQSQVGITPTGGFLLRDTTGQNFTGNDPGAGTITRNGILYGSPVSGEGAGLISLDPEGIAFRADGSFYVSDEYSTGLLYFDATGRQIGAIPQITAFLPLTGGVVNFNSVNPGTVGRRNNQGLEAVAVTPRGDRLVTVLQSATVQDTNGANQQTRNNTRILVYDISTNATPTNPIGHYVLQLPTFTLAGDGTAVNRTAAQSEIVALNSNQFLVLARDGIGRGAGAAPSGTAVIKSILLIDTSRATNLAGTAFETSYAPIATNGVLNSTIVPVQQVELVNFLNPVQLGRFGLNLNTTPSNATSLSEKLEALGLAPVLDESRPQDFFLLVGNDNDFQANNGFVNGQPFNASLTGTGGTGNNDNVLLVYRLTLPTYVDPQALASLNAGAIRVAIASRTAARDIGRVGTDAAINWLTSQRTLDNQSFGTGPRIWTQLDFARSTATAPGVTVRADGLSASGGVDYGFGFGRVGVLVGYRSIDGGFGVGTSLKGDGTVVGAYGAISGFGGAYLQVAGAKSVSLKLSELNRRAAYGQSATGKTAGDTKSASGEIGYVANFGPLRAGPFGAIDYVDTTIDGYGESGASVSNATFGALTYKRIRSTVGLDASIGSDKVRMSVRGGYSFEDERGDRQVSARLTSAQHSDAAVQLSLPSTKRNAILAGGRLEGTVGPLLVRAAAEGRFGRGEDEARVNVGVGVRF